jgi:endoglucanase
MKFITVLIVSLSIFHLGDKYALAEDISCLVTEGRHIIDKSGKKVHLKGVNITDLEIIDKNRPGMTIQKILQKAIDPPFKCSLIRIPVLPFKSEIDKSNGFFYNKDEYYQKYIFKAVKLCVENRIYCIISLQLTENYSSELRDKVIIPFWEYIAPRLKNYPNVLFEILNEAVYPNDWDLFKAVIAQPVTDKIRLYSEKNLILIGGPYYNIRIKGAVKNRVQGKNIAYALHIYPQHGNNWDELYGDVVNNLPVIVTEWGFEPGFYPASGTVDNFGYSFAKWLNKNQLPWVAWIFDNVWTPRIFNEDWTLRSGNEGMGSFVIRLINNEKMD